MMSTKENLPAPCRMCSVVYGFVRAETGSFLYSCNCSELVFTIEEWLERNRVLEKQYVKRTQQQCSQLQELNQRLDALHEGITEIALESSRPVGAALYRLMEKDRKTTCPCGATSRDEYSAHTDKRCPFYAT